MTDLAPILVVDDEYTNCFILKTNLELEGYSVDIALSAEEALQKELSTYSLFLLDVMMGEMNGYELAHKLRNDETTAHIPIIMCTAKCNEDDILMGYDCGIDDYIRKPFSIKELLLRVKSVLKRTYKTSKIYRFGELSINTVTKRCYINSHEVVLTKTEYELLFILFCNNGRIVSREEIITEIWHNDADVLDRTVDVNINRLRKKLGDYGKHIITKSGIGYGFNKNI